jgi:hypothetical protein
VAAELAIGLAAVSSACATSGDDDASTTGARVPFVAFAGDFTGFRRWKSVPATSTTPPASVHTSGPRTVYIDREPPAGATSFPTGTIIVKEFEGAALGDRTVFAMVKRGGDYNAAGARGWEWFELQNLDDEKVSILWRGVGPPAGEKYGGDPNGGCNGCHGAAKANDSVQTSGLALDAGGGG